MGKEFDTRLKMIEALEETKDDATLLSLVRGDTYLASYSHVLSRACCHLNDPKLVKKLLNLPVLNTTSELYKTTVGSVFSNIASDERNLNPEIETLLFDCIKDDQDTKDRAIRQIFSTVSSHGAEQPSKRLAQLLIENGADLTNAVMLEKMTLDAQKSEAQRRLDNVEKFRLSIFKP